MINPQSIDLASLPCVELSDRSLLPGVAAIYFAVDDSGVVQYIGKTKNLNRRWIAHHRLRELKSIPGIKISYMMLDTDMLGQVEDALIFWFKPPLNGVRPSSAIAMARISKAEDKAYGETKKPKQFLITDTASARIDILAGVAGVSRSEFVERIIRWADEKVAEQLKEQPGGDRA